MLGSNIAVCMFETGKPMTTTIRERWRNIIVAFTVCLGSFLFAMACAGILAFTKVPEQDFNVGITMTAMLMGISTACGAITAVIMLFNACLMIRDALVLAAEHDKTLTALKRAQSSLGHGIRVLADSKSDEPNNQLRELRESQARLLLQQATEQLDPDLHVAHLPEQFNVLKMRLCKRIILETMQSGNAPNWLVTFARVHHRIKKGFFHLDATA